MADRAGVSVQTLIRHFGSKEELFAAVWRDIAAAEGVARVQSPVGDVEGAMANVCAHYERTGERVLRALPYEQRLEAIRVQTEYGRQIHYEWVERTFAPFLAGLGPAERRRRRAQLIALTDVYTWKLLRRDLGLGPRQVELAMTEMVSSLLKGGR